MEAERRGRESGGTESGSNPDSDSVGVDNISPIPNIEQCVWLIGERSSIYSKSEINCLDNGYYYFFKMAASTSVC